jgi:hypothetical protein
MVNKKEFPENEQIVIDGLKEVKAKIRDMAYTLILDGEAKYMSNDKLGEGYPFDPKDYLKDSLDPQVVALAALMDKVDETIGVMNE